MFNYYNIIPTGTKRDMGLKLAKFLYLCSGDSNVQSPGITENVGGLGPVLIDSFGSAPRTRVDDDVTVAALELVDGVDAADVEAVVEIPRKGPTQVRNLCSVRCDDADGRTLLALGAGRRFLKDADYSVDDFSFHVVTDSVLVASLSGSKLRRVDENDRHLDPRVGDFLKPVLSSDDVDAVAVEVEGPLRNFFGTALKLAGVGQEVCNRLDLPVHSILKRQRDDVVVVFQVSEERLLQPRLSGLAALNDRRKLLRVADEDKLVAREQRTERGQQQSLTGLVEDAVVELSSGDRRMTDPKAS